ncbi:MAG: polysaccharide deacetylase family protein [Chloroflexota bacterium]|nr:polysaccharide deacetylase family protein [Chloroflexota bacterium]
MKNGRFAPMKWTHAFSRGRAIMLLTLLLVGMQPAAVSAATISGTDAVNIRSCPSLDCDVVGIAPLGSDVDVAGDEQDGWVPVSWGNVQGFAFALYVGSDTEAPWLVQGDPACNQVALIFNIGIGEVPSASVIDTLIGSDVPATMFPMGWWAEAYPDYLKTLDEAGFVIGTHGDQQLFLTTLGDETITTDVTDSVSAIEAVIGREIDPWVTPYAADTDDRVRRLVAGMGLMPVGWTVAAADYGADATADSVYTRVMSGIGPGAIVEMHLDGPATDVSTALALPLIIRDIQAQGYDLVTIPELAEPCTR